MSEKQWSGTGETFQKNNHTTCFWRVYKFVIWISRMIQIKNTIVQGNVWIWLHSEFVNMSISNVLFFLSLRNVWNGEIYESLLFEFPKLWNCRFGGRDGCAGGYTPPPDIVNLHCLGIDLDPMQLSDVAGWIPPLIQPNGLALHIEASNCQTYCCVHEPHGYSHFGSNIPAFVQAIA